MIAFWNGRGYVTRESMLSIENMSKRHWIFRIPNQFYYNCFRITDVPHDDFKYVTVSVIHIFLFILLLMMTRILWIVENGFWRNALAWKLVVIFIQHYTSKNFGRHTFLWMEWKFQSKLLKIIICGWRISKIGV